MSEEYLRWFDFEQKTLEGYLKRSGSEQQKTEEGYGKVANTFKTNGVFEEWMVVAPLTEALKEAGVPNYDIIASVCRGSTSDFEFEKRLRLSYVFAFVFGFSSFCKHIDSPCCKINSALLDYSTLSSSPARKLV